MSKIYHYTSLSTAVKFILPSRTLRTNSLANTNDPRENQPWTFGGVNIDYPNIYPSTYNHNTHIDHQFKLGKEIKEQVQILCFVDSLKKPGFENEMMWAHYTENHEGICIGIDEDIFLEENSESPIFKLENVNYKASKKPSLYWNPQLNKLENIRNFINKAYRNLILSKSQYWEHEYEKRLLIISSEHHYLSIEKSLTGIYCGLLMNSNFRPAIDRHIDPKQTKIYELYYERQQLKAIETEFGEYRPMIFKKYQ